MDKKTPDKPVKLSYPDNLITVIGGILLPLSDDQLGGLKYVISTLLDREQRILMMRFEENQTYREIGAVFGISSGRIHQIVGKAIRKLRNPARYAYIKNGLEGIKKNPGDVKVLGDGFPVTLMGLSTRNINILERAQIDTIGKVCDLLETDPARFRRLRNFGRGCLKELLMALRKYGVEFEDDSIDSIVEEIWYGETVNMRRIDEG